MKIDLDLSDIYEDEEGYKMRPDFIETVARSIANNLKGTVVEEMKSEINAQITSLINQNIEQEMPKILNEFLDYKYDEVTSWGEKKATWTVRDRIAHAVKEATGFQRQDYWSSNKETPFTKLLVKAINEAIEPMTKDLRNTMNAEFKKACVDEAARQLSEKLNLNIKI